MRIALISDIHGNMIAFEAVLQDIARSGVDQIYFLGDSAALGPQPGEVLQRLRELDCPCIQGNHDEFMLDAELIKSYIPIPLIQDADAWCRDQLSEADMKFLGKFHDYLYVDLPGERKLLLFHGSPHLHMHDIRATTPEEDLDEKLQGFRADLMAGGHTHIQMLRQHRGMLLINPGSVGIPFVASAPGPAPTIMSHAEYAVLDVTGEGIDISLRRLQPDIPAMRKAADIAGFPFREVLLQVYR